MSGVWMVFCLLILLPTKTSWASAAHGYLTVVNLRVDGVEMRLDRRGWQMMAPHSGSVFFLRPGNHTVEVRTRSGRRLDTHSVAIRPTQGAIVEVQPDPTILSMVNRSGTSIRVTVAEDQVRLRPNQRREWTVNTGRVHVEATYTQHGIDHVLMSRRVLMSDGQRREIEVSPADNGWVRVINDSQTPGIVRINNRNSGLIVAGGQRWVSTPLGVVNVAVVHGSRVLDMGHLTIKRYEDAIFRVRPLTGRLSISNPLPIPIRVVSQTNQATIPAGGAVSWPRLAPGEQRLTMYRIEGERIDGGTVLVRRGEVVEYAVGAPQDGIILITNGRGDSIQYFSGGRLLGTAPPNSTTRVVLPLGQHRLRITGSGGFVMNKRLSVDRYAITKVEVRSRHGCRNSQTVSHHHRGHTHPLDRRCASVW